MSLRSRSFDHATTGAARASRGCRQRAALHRYAHARPNVATGEVGGQRETNEHRISSHERAQNIVGAAWCSSRRLAAWLRPVFGATEDRYRKENDTLRSHKGLGPAAQDNR